MCCRQNFICASILDHFQTKMFQSETTSLHYFSPRIQNIGHPTLGSEGEKTFKRYLNSEHTNRRTDRRTRRWTFRLIESIGPEDRCFENKFCLDQWVFFFWFMEFTGCLECYLWLSKKVHAPAKRAKKEYFLLNKRHPEKLSGKSAAFFCHFCCEFKSQDKMSYQFWRALDVSFKKMPMNLVIFRYFFCCINLCPDQSCQGKSVKQCCLQVEKT